MNIKPRDGVLIIRKHKKTHLKADIAIEENDEDKRLITGEVIEAPKVSWYKKGQTIIFGKYALYRLTVKSEDYYFIAHDDVIGTCSYREDE